jgi:hypothetical protein
MWLAGPEDCIANNVADLMLSPRFSSSSLHELGESPTSLQLSLRLLQPFSGETASSQLPFFLFEKTIVPWNITY